MALSTLTTNKLITEKVIDIVITDDFKDNWSAMFEFFDTRTGEYFIEYSLFDTVFEKYVQNSFSYYDNGKSGGENLYLQWLNYIDRYGEQLVRRLDTIADIKNFKSGWSETYTDHKDIDDTVTSTETNVLDGKTTNEREVSDNGTDNTTTTNSSDTEGTKSVFNSSDYEPSTEVSSSGSVSSEQTITNTTTDTSTIERDDTRTISRTDITEGNTSADGDRSRIINNIDNENAKMRYIIENNKTTIRTEFIDGFARFCLI